MDHLSSLTSSHSGHEKGQQYYKCDFKFSVQTLAFPGMSDIYPAGLKQPLYQLPMSPTELHRGLSSKTPGFSLPPGCKSFLILDGRELYCLYVQESQYIMEIIYSFIL